MGTPHNEAAQGAFAKTVLMPGDPLRAKFIAETFLQDAKLVNNVRGVQGYTGTYQGTPVSSTGFGTGGATREDVALFAKHVGPDVKIKAAGGIADLKDAEDFINLGASRLGTSRIVKAVKAMEQ